MSKISTPHKFKVCISSGKDSVIFEASVPVSEARQANYVGYDIIHSPTEILAYKNTTSRKFNISGKLISRTPDEANLNGHYINLIRSWVLPDFGGSGATPPILVFSAFNNSNMNNVQCVLKSYSINYQDDVDWIMKDSKSNRINDPMPVVCLIQVDLDEIYTPLQLRSKDWKINIKEPKDTTTPSTQDIPAGGIAHENINANNLLKFNFGVAEPFSNGNNSSVLGISNDSAFSNATPPFTSNIEQNSAIQYYNSTDPINVNGTSLPRYAPKPIIP